MTMELPGKSVVVEIHGRTYQIRSKDDDQYILKLAKMVDSKMKEVEKATHTVDSIRVAVLTALNLADQLLKTKENLDNRVREYEQEQRRLQERIQFVLEKAKKNTLPDA